MDELIRELGHFGLSEKEAAVYLAALELGPSPVQDISHKSKVNRATTYVMIESLTGRGLMSSYVKGKKRFYVSEAPERLKTILQAQRREIEEKESELENVLPMLMALFNAEGAKPQVRYLEGPDGLVTVRDIFARQEGEFVQIVPLDELKELDKITHSRDEHVAEMKKMAPEYRAILVTGKTDFSNVAEIPKGEVRLLPKEKFPIHAEISVRGNHVFLFSYKSSILAVVMISQEIADGIRALFDLAWEGTKSYPSKKYE